MAALLLCLVAVVLCQHAEARRPLLYAYRYETEDLNTAASGVPAHGYHFVEGGYYPESGLSRFGHIGAGLRPAFLPGVGPVGGGYPGGYVQPHLHSAGGEIFDRSAYRDGSQTLNDAQFEKSHVAADQEGRRRGEARAHNGKGETHAYQSAHGAKQASADGKNYHGARHFDQRGQNADEQKQQQGHTKGHVVKGYKSSHHKDETGRTEEYYDEAHDEAGHASAKGTAGSFGEEATHAFEGARDDGRFDADASSRRGHVEDAHSAGNANADVSGYAQRQSHATHSGVDRQSLLGQQEATAFAQHRPIHTPFFKAY